MSQLADKLCKSQNYLSSARYISGRIIEYDIKSANINCLRHAKVISQNEYDYLNKLPKQQREIEIGLMEKKDPSIYTILQKTILESRRYFIDNNNLQEDNIIRIANDAIYVNSSVDLYNTKFGEYIQYRPKSISNCFVNLNNSIVIFLKFLLDGNIDVDIKGIGKQLYLHQKYMVSGLSYTIAILERSSSRDACVYLSNLVQSYLTLSLPVGYYREFNSDSLYRIKSCNNLAVSTLGLSDISDNSIDKTILDISYNYNIMRELWSILIDLYLTRKR